MRNTVNILFALSALSLQPAYAKGESETATREVTVKFGFDCKDPGTVKVKSEPKEKATEVKVSVGKCEVGCTITIKDTNN